MRSMAAHRTCMDTCYKARDGVCDEGRPARTAMLSSNSSTQAQVLPLLCDLGTDCSDCGAWEGTRPGPWDEHAGPVAWARARNMSMQVRVTNTPVPFVIAVTSAAADPDVSAMLTHYGAMEGGVSRVVHWLLNGTCVLSGGVRRVVVDAGASLGYYTLMAAAYGCQVVAWEPLRMQRAFLDWSVHANGVASWVEVRPVALTDNATAATRGSPAQQLLEEALTHGSASSLGDLEPPVGLLPPRLADLHQQVRSGALSGTLRVGMPRDGTYWGLASVNSLNLHPHERRGEVWVPAETLDQWAEERRTPSAAWWPWLFASLHLTRPQPLDVALLKMDVEGWEPQILQGAAALLACGSVESLLLEYSPGIVERHRDLDAQAALPRSLLPLVSPHHVSETPRALYSLLHLPTFEFAAPWPPKRLNGSEPLPTLEEVTTDEVQWDLLAIAQRKALEHEGECLIAKELQQFGVWSGCREWAYGAHPKGFRSSFGFNTNLWAARKGSAAERLMRPTGRSSLFAQDQDMKVWTSQQRPGKGIGLLDCKSIGAGHKVLFRCPCSPEDPPDSECRRQEAVVLRLAAEGNMPMQ